MLLNTTKKHSDQRDQRPGHKKLSRMVAAAILQAPPAFILVLRDGDPANVLHPFSTNQESRVRVIVTHLHAQLQTALAFVVFPILRRLHLLNPWSPSPVKADSSHSSFRPSPSFFPPWHRLVNFLDILNCISPFKASQSISCTAQRASSATKLFSQQPGRPVSKPNP